MEKYQFFWVDQNKFQQKTRTFKQLYFLSFL